MTLVSVFIPTHNRPGMLWKAAKSALAQTHPDLELIIVLNGATPETADVAQSLASNGARIVTLTNHTTPGAARNAGIKHARGEWLAFLDDDD